MLIEAAAKNPPLRRRGHKTRNLDGGVATESKNGLFRLQVHLAVDEGGDQVSVSGTSSISANGKSVIEALGSNSRRAWCPHVLDWHYRLILEIALLVAEAKDLERCLFVSQADTPSRKPKLLR
jgi:hypothetical protein